MRSTRTPARRFASPSSAARPGPKQTATSTLATAWSATRRSFSTRTARGRTRRNTSSTSPKRLSRTFELARFKYKQEREKGMQQQLTGQAYLERYGHAWNEPGLAQQ